jgi:hypothetical protein
MEAAPQAALFRDGCLGRTKLRFVLDPSLENSAGEE